MRALDDDGVELNADFLIERVGDRLTLVLESQGGSKTSPHARNPDYADALTLLLDRLKRLGAILIDGEVDSKETTHLPLFERRLALREHTYPVSLADEADIKRLRHAVTGSQKGIGRVDGAKVGNPRRRIRLTLEVPGFGPDDAAPLAAALIVAQQRTVTTTSDRGPGLTTYRLRPVERMHTTRSEYDRSPRTIVVTRAEAELVGAYLRWLGHAETATRSETESGITDIHLDGPSGAEIVEAKRTAGHLHCRIALGQLLDYATSMPVPVGRLTALFPARPGDPDVNLMHTYGIDCVFQQDPVFVRIEAPDHCRDRMWPIWNAGDLEI